MATTKSLGQKDGLDRFYTLEEVAAKCIAQLNLSDYDMIIEPSAGSGSFSKQIKDCKAFDIAPADDSIIQADWFEVDKSQFGGKCLVIGNPPFGQQNTLATRFFNSAAEFADTIAFILPRSFKKASVQSRLNPYFHLVSELGLDEQVFLLNGERYGVPTVFQIWKKQNSKRSTPKLKLTTPYFTFVKRPEGKIRIQRVGGNAGKASLNLDYAAASNYFVVNNTSMTDEEFVEFVNGLIYPSITYTVGPKSLSKGELIQVFEESYA